MDQHYPMSMIRDNPTQLSEILANQKPAWTPGNILIMNVILLSDCH